MIDIIGLFIVVFGCVAINKLLGFSDGAMVVGTVIGGCSWVLLRLSN